MPAINSRLIAPSAKSVCIIIISYRYGNMVPEAEKQKAGGKGAAGVTVITSDV
jgi:hypothetical protein